MIGTVNFTLNAVPIIPNRLTDFSAAGPNVDIGIKPDLAAVGGDIYVATQTLDPRGDMYDPSGYMLVDGTSFSTPLVVGGAALIKSARPGLTMDQYRSLLINTAAAVQTHSGQTPGIQQAGAGMLEAAAALVLYQLVVVNYGAFASAEDAERFGAAALGLPRDDYYALICRLADSLPDGH